MKLLFLDFETMGVDTSSCPAVDMSALTVDTDKMLSDEPYTCRDIARTRKFKLSVRDQVQSYGAVVEKDTLKFWESLSPEARKAVKPSESDLTVKEFCHQVIEYMNDNGKTDYWFTRGNNFDPPILERLFRYADKSHLFREYFKFYKVQDTRTFINAKLDYPKSSNICPIQDEEFWKKIFVEHDSSWDILADVLRYQTIIRLEHDLEQTRR